MSSDSGFTPGWYPDPRVASQQRYHDGTVWTDHVAPAEPGGPATSSAGPFADRGLSSIGSLLSESWRVMVKRIGSLFGVTVAAGLVAAVFAAIFVGILVGTEPSGGVAFLLILALVVVVIAVYAAHQLIVARIFLAEHYGVTLSAGDAWTQTKGRIVGLVATYIGIAIAVMIGFVILGLLLSSANPTVSRVVLLLVLAVVWVKTSFIATAAAATGSGSILDRSTRVSSGRFWQVAARLLCLWLISFVWSFIMQRVVSSVSDTTSLVVVAVVVQVLGSLLASLFYAAGAAKIFLETGGSTDIRVVSN